MEYTWEASKDRYQSGERLLVNKVNVGCWFWNASSSREENTKYSIETRLPGFIFKIKRFQTEKDAKQALEAFTKRWFERFIAPQALTSKADKGE